MFYRHFLLTLFCCLCFLTTTLLPQRAVLFNGAGNSQLDKVTAMALAGIVNRDSARLYLLNVYEAWSYNQTDEKWRDLYRSRGGVVFDSVTTITALVNKFRHLLNGAVTYDQNRYFSNFSGQSFNWSIEQAALIGSLCNRIPLTAGMATVLGLTVNDSILVTDSFNGDAPAWLPGRLELSAHPWNNSSLTEEQRYLTLLDFGIRSILPLCNPTKFYIREYTDWPAKHKMFQVNLAGTADLDFSSLPSARAEIIERVLVYIHSKNPASIFHIYGWMRPEPLVQWFACFGASFHETLLSNLSFHSAWRRAQRPLLLPAAVNPDTVTVRSKYYILFAGSEGDAANWALTFQSGAWLSSQRGTVPVGWGWNLHLLDECPFVAEYYYQTATANDGMLSVTSPLGYAYPDLWGDSVVQGAATASRNLMQAFGFGEIYAYKHYASTGTTVYRGKTISNSFNFQRLAAFQNALRTPLTLLFDPQLANQAPNTFYGHLMFNHSDNSFYGDVSTAQVAANRITAALKLKTRPGFLLAGYQRFRQDDFANRTDPGNSDVNFSRLLEVVSLLKADTAVGRYVEVVTPQYFSVLLRKQLGLPVNVDETVESNAMPVLAVYPNPAYGTASVVVEMPRPCTGSITLYGLPGNVVKEWQGIALGEGYTRVPLGLNSVPAGMYIVVVRAAGKSSAVKLLLLR